MGANMTPHPCPTTTTTTHSLSPPSSSRSPGSSAGRLSALLFPVSRLVAGTILQTASPHIQTQSTKVSAPPPTRPHLQQTLSLIHSTAAGLQFPLSFFFFFFLLLFPNYLTEDEVAHYHPPTPSWLQSAERPQMNNFRVSLSLLHSLSLSSLSCSN